jgi:hypothetical protein
MSRQINIVALADQLVMEAKLAAVKTASAPATPAEPAILHPVAAFLKQAAAQLRAIPDEPSVSLAVVEKVAMALGGKGSLNVGSTGGSDAQVAAPTLPGLKSTNLGVTAGGGGAAPSAVKAASEIRKVAAVLRTTPDMDTASGHSKAAHILNAASGLHHLFQGIR